jgi:hypothetical protein
MKQVPVFSPQFIEQETTPFAIGNPGPGLG